MLIRVIENLIRNSIQHANGEISAQVKKFVNAEKEQSGEIIFSNRVENRDEINISRIFERFYTGDKARLGSAGLGVSIVKLLSEEMGGTAEAEMAKDILKIKVRIPLWK